jgi:hypothetical protein
LLAGFIALGIVVVAYNYIKNYFTSIDEIIQNRVEFIILLLLIGPIIGILVTILSLRKISLKI